MRIERKKRNHPELMNEYNEANGVQIRSRSRGSRCDIVRDDDVTLTVQ